jgi:hypothetical protein
MLNQFYRCWLQTTSGWSLAYAILRRPQIFHQLPEWLTDAQGRNLAYLVLMNSARTFKVFRLHAG